MINLKVAKFTTRVVLTLILMLFGISIFFLSDDNSMKLVGSNMVTASWASWMSMGSSKLTKTSKDKEPVVESV